MAETETRWKKDDDKLKDKQTSTAMVWEKKPPSQTFLFFILHYL